MSGIHILPNLEVKTGGVMSLRVVPNREWIRQKGYNPDSGFGFSQEMSDRYGGKKLKLYKVFTDPDCSQGSGATRRLSFSEDGDDTYKWNEFMFQEYWDALGGAKPAREAETKVPTKPKVAAKPAPTKVLEPEHDAVVGTAKKSKKSGSLVKMLVLMSILNQAKAPATVAAEPIVKHAKPAAKPA